MASPSNAQPLPQSWSANPFFGRPKEEEKKQNALFLDF
jgi:hypothetical protein